MDREAAIRYEPVPRSTAFAEKYLNSQSVGWGPFPFPDLEELSVAVELGFKVKASNGTTLTERSLSKVARRLNLVAVGLGGREEIHNHLQGRPDYFACAGLVSAGSTRWTFPAPSPFEFLSKHREVFFGPTNSPSASVPSPCGSILSWRPVERPRAAGGLFPPRPTKLP